MDSIPRKTIQVNHVRIPPQLKELVQGFLKTLHSLRDMVVYSTWSHPTQIRTWWRCFFSSLILCTIASHFLTINLCPLWKNSLNFWGFLFSINYPSTVRKEIQSHKRLLNPCTCTHLMSQHIGKLEVVSKASCQSFCLRRPKVIGIL